MSDWRSDVCSSDLGHAMLDAIGVRIAQAIAVDPDLLVEEVVGELGDAVRAVPLTGEFLVAYQIAGHVIGHDRDVSGRVHDPGTPAHRVADIGRAACRDSGCQAV